MLHQFEIKQSRVRDLPLFLHSNRISIPNVLKFDTIHIKTTPPKYFIQALKYLRLTNSRNIKRLNDNELIYNNESLIEE